MRDDFVGAPRFGAGPATDAIVLSRYTNSVYGNAETLLTRPNLNGMAGILVAHCEGVATNGVFRCRPGDNIQRSLTGASGANDTFTCSGHNYLVGEGPLKLAGSTLPGGLSAGDLLFIAQVVDANTFKVAKRNWSINASAVSGDTITFATSHMRSTGDAVQVSGADLPPPLVAGRSYGLIKVDATNIKLAETPQKALAGTAITLTGAGSGTRTVSSWNIEDLVTVDMTSNGTPASWTLGGMPAAPTAAITDGYGSFRILVGETRRIVAPARLTVKGGGTSDILTYWWI